MSRGWWSGRKSKLQLPSLTGSARRDVLRARQHLLSRRDALLAGGSLVLTAAALSGCETLSMDPAGKDDDGKARSTRKGKEAPMLARLVKAGDLPPVEQRLPKEPLVVQPVARIGQYGGVWRTALLGAADAAWLDRTIGYDYLMRWNPEWTATIPNVALSIEVARGGREYVITLREGMRWSDGKPFTADDLVFAYNDVTADTELTPNPPPLLAHFEKIDEVTVRVTYESPYGFFLLDQAQAGGSGLVSRPFHYLKQFHNKYNPDVDSLVEKEGAADWVELFQRKGGVIEGTTYNARFMNPELPTLCAWRITTPLGEGSRVVAERNPYYWKVDPEGSQLPYLDEVRFDVISDPEVMLARATNGDFDMHDRHITTSVNKPVLARSREKGNYDFFNHVTSSMNAVAIALNLTCRDPVKREIFNNKDFRIGLSHAINREELIDAVFQRQGRPWQLAPREESEFYLEELATQYLEYDVDLASQHLDKAGYAERDDQGRRLGPDGKPIQFTVEVASGISDTAIDAMDLIKKYWAEVGITIQVRTEDRALFYTRKEANQHDANVWGGDGGLTDAIIDPRWYFPFSTESNYAIPWANWYNGNTPAMEPPAHVKQQMRLYDQIKASPDPEERRNLFMQILEIAKDQFYAIGCVLPEPGYGIVKNNFHNVPKSFPSAWVYPNPGPTNPEQYFISS